MARVIALLVLATVAVSGQTETARFDVVSIKRNVSRDLGVYGGTAARGRTSCETADGKLGPQLRATAMRCALRKRLTASCAAHDGRLPYAGFPPNSFCLLP